MPCSDSGAPYPPTEEELLERKVPAMLCAVWSVMSADMRLQVLGDVNWLEAGVTRDELFKWIMLHERRDRSRRAEEARKRQVLELKARALAKLTDAERAVLGLK
jgi:hypothetical protein